MKKLSKIQAKEQIQKFFADIKNKNPKDIKKIKTLAMQYNIPLGSLRKKFCKKCFSPHRNSKTRIHNKMKSITCENCNYVSKWKTNSS